MKAIIFFLFAVSVFGQNINLHNGLISYWKFDGNLFDSHGNNNGNSSTGVTTLSQNGVINTCPYFNGTQNAYIDFGNDQSLNITGSGLTMSAWVYNEKTSGRGDIISKGRDYTSNYGYHLLWYTNPNRIQGLYRLSNGQNNYVEATGLLNNTWYHVVSTFDGRFGKIYINGNLVNTYETIGSIGNAVTPFIIGAHSAGPTGWGYQWHGMIDEVGIWNRALNEVEIATLYNSGNGLQYPFNIISNKKLLYLKLGEPSSWTIPGASGSQYKEISEWESNGYEVTKMNLENTTINAALLQNYDALRVTLYWHRNFTEIEGEAIKNWVFNGGNFLIDCPYNSAINSIKHFGVDQINGAGGGSTGLSWYYYGAPLIVGPINGPISPYDSLACECLDRPVLITNHQFQILASYQGYPAFVKREYGQGKVIIGFLNGWSHDQTYPGNAYRANIYQGNNLAFLRDCISYFNSTTVISEINIIPLNYSIFQNYPNPFNPSTTIKYSIVEESGVRINIYNLLGELVTELVNTEQQAGYYETKFEAKNLPSGVYFYSISAEPVNGGNVYRNVKKMLLVK